MLTVNRNRTRKRIASGNIKVTVQKNPAFLYEGDIAGKNFDPEDVVENLVFLLSDIHFLISDSRLVYDLIFTLSILLTILDKFLLSLV